MTMECPVLVDMATAVPAYEAQGTQQKWDRQIGQAVRAENQEICFDFVFLRNDREATHLSYTTTVWSPEQGRTIDQLTW